MNRLAFSASPYYPRRQRGIKREFGGVNKKFANGELSGQTKSSHLRFAVTGLLGPLLHALDGSADCGDMISNCEIRPDRLHTLKTRWLIRIGPMEATIRLLSGGNPHGNASRKALVVESVTAARPFPDASRGAPLREASEGA